MPSRTDILIGQVLRELRIRQGLTQGHVATALCQPQSHVSKTESGERPMRLGEAFAYALALGVTVDELFAQVRDAVAQEMLPPAFGTPNLEARLLASDLESRERARA